MLEQFFDWQMYYPNYDHVIKKFLHNCFHWFRLKMMSFLLICQLPPIITVQGNVFSDPPLQFFRMKWWKTGLTSFGACFWLTAWMPKNWSCDLKNFSLIDFIGLDNNQDNSSNYCYNPFQGITVFYCACLI
jgi:hypothetical protein